MGQMRWARWWRPGPGQPADVAINPAADRCTSGHGAAGRWQRGGHASCLSAGGCGPDGGGHCLIRGLIRLLDETGRVIPARDFIFRRRG